MEKQTITYYDAVYDKDYNLIGIEKDRGLEWVYTYDADGRLTTENYFTLAFFDGQVKPNERPSAVTQYSYNDEGLLIREDYYIYGDQLDRYWLYSYDAQARSVIKTEYYTTGFGGGCVDKVTTTYYSEDGRALKVAVIDESGYTETKTYSYRLVQLPEDAFVPTDFMKIPDAVQPFWPYDGQLKADPVFDEDKALYEQAVAALETYAATGEISYEEGIDLYTGEDALWVIYTLFMRLGEYQQSPQYMQEVFGILQAL
jgi:YD repeat-containing protein